MSYYFKQHETLTEGLRRIGGEQLQKSINKLQDGDMPVEERIHAARKHGKKIRALLRIVRPGMEEIYKQENVNIRDACRLLAPLRDFDAMQNNLQSIIGKEKDKVAIEAMQKMSEALSRWIDEQCDDIDSQALINEACGMFESSLQRVGKWKVQSKAEKALYKGLKKTYKRGRSAMQKAYDEPTGDNFHEWRKRVKYHRYHVRLLRHAWRPLLNPLRKELHVASNFLGEEHDLTVLMEHLEILSGDFLKKEDVEKCSACFENHRLMLRDNIHSLGLRLFSEKPKHMAGRLQDYYRIWSSD